MSSQMTEAGDAKTFRLIVMDRKNGMLYLTDTGAEVSIIPKKQSEVKLH